MYSELRDGKFGIPRPYRTQSQKVKSLIIFLIVIALMSILILGGIANEAN